MALADLPYAVVDTLTKHMGLGTPIMFAEDVKARHQRLASTCRHYRDYYALNAARHWPLARSPAIRCWGVLDRGHSMLHGGLLPTLRGSGAIVATTPAALNFVDFGAGDNNTAAARGLQQTDARAAALAGQHNKHSGHSNYHRALKETIRTHPEGWSALRNINMATGSTSTDSARITVPTYGLLRVHHAADDINIQLDRNVTGYAIGNVQADKGPQQPVVAVLAHCNGEHTLRIMRIRDQGNWIDVPVRRDDDHRFRAYQSFRPRIAIEAGRIRCIYAYKTNERQRRPWGRAWDTTRAHSFDVTLDADAKNAVVRDICDVAVDQDTMTEAESIDLNPNGFTVGVGHSSVGNYYLDNFPDMAKFLVLQFYDTQGKRAHYESDGQAFEFVRERTKDNTDPTVTKDKRVAIVQILGDVLETNRAATTQLRMYELINLRHNAPRNMGQPETPAIGEQTFNFIRECLRGTGPHASEATFDKYWTQDYENEQDTEKDINRNFQTSQNGVIVPVWLPAQGRAVLIDYDTESNQNNLHLKLYFVNFKPIHKDAKIQQANTKIINKHYGCNAIVTGYSAIKKHHWDCHPPIVVNMKLTDPYTHLTKWEADTINGLLNCDGFKDTTHPAVYQSETQ